VLWTKDSLCKLVEEKLHDYLFIVVSNREPYIHNLLKPSSREIAVEIPPSGLTVALDPVMQACGGTWIAHGSGSADNLVVDSRNKVRVPPLQPSYSLKRVWLSEEEEQGYYYGFSNASLWPLCHIAYAEPVFNDSDWHNYRKVNDIFARNLVEEVGDRKAFVFIQDYHLALLPRLIKERYRKIITAQFWHIPWPNPEVFGICPWQTEILEGLL
jgi:trehalose 6-phosphate synthase